MNEELVSKTEQAVAGTDEPSEQEKALVNEWEKRLTAARKADVGFRKSVIRDRKFATGEALIGYEVSTNLVQATIDTLIPFLFAKDPDVDVVPQDQVSAPIKPRLVAPPPPQGAVGPDGQPMMAPDGVPISPDPQQIAEYGMAMQEYMAQQAQEQAIADEERARNDFIRRLGQTIEIVISRFWKKGNLKGSAKQWLRASMTSAEGWLKVSMQGDLVPDHTVQKELYEIQQQQQSIEALKRCIQEGDTRDYDAELEQLRVKEEGLQGRLETYVGRCLVFDWVDTLDFQAPSTLRMMSEYLSSPWLADATYYSISDACAKFGLDKKQLAHAAKWNPPEETVDDSTNGTVTTAFTADGEAWKKATPADGEGFVRVWEINAKCDNIIYTWIEGTKFWAKQPHAPRLPTTRFYPYFLLALYECDANRHPQSLAWRLSKLQEEYASTRSNLAETRRRAKPGILFDSTNIEPGDADKMQQGGNQEYIPIKPIRPGEPLGSSFAPKPYNTVDGSLYDTSPIRSDMETVSGAQEALSQGIRTAKTATEADIQQSGFTSKTAYSRDALDMALEELAQYSAELGLGGLSLEQVKEWAGPHAVWPQGIEAEKLQSLVYVSIRAGSTGKPNTASERQAWSAILPQIQGLMGLIGEARGADPQEMADKYTELLRETVLRTGDRIDVDRFLPMPSPNAQAGMPPPGSAGGAPVQSNVPSPSGAPGAGAQPPTDPAMLN